MGRNDCYACRVYYTDCTHDAFEPHVLVDAKHHNGGFWWGRDLKNKPGRWVKICRDCIQAMSD